MTNTQRYHRLIPSPLGEMLLIAANDALIGVYFTDQKHLPAQVKWGLPATHHPILQRAQAQLNTYFDGTLTHFDLPLLPQGSPFQSAVWESLTTIPSGTVARYGEIATRLGRPNAVRAAANAIGANPLTIIIPCHRVIGASGALTGYAGGLARKAFLLKHEKAVW